MIQIRQANHDEKDLLKIVDFQLKMSFETEHLQLDFQVLYQGVLAVLQDSLKGRYYLAYEGEEILGCMLTLPEWSDWRNGTVLWIHSVYVESAFRKKGVFKALYAHLKELIRGNPQLNIRGLRLYVDKRNEKAKRVYEKLGMSNEHYDLYEWLID